MTREMANTPLIYKQKNLARFLRLFRRWKQRCREAELPMKSQTRLIKEIRDLLQSVKAVDLTMTQVRAAIRTQPMANARNPKFNDCLLFIVWDLSENDGRAIDYSVIMSKNAIRNAANALFDQFPDDWYSVSPDAQRVL